MAEVYKSLGQVDLTATTLTDVYTVPASTSAIADVTFANRGATDVTIRLSHAPAGAGDALSQYKVYDLVLPGGAIYVHPAPIKMATTDKLRAKCSSANVVSVTVDGVEIT